jgi:excisionase family DNA binding protein
MTSTSKTFLTLQDLANRWHISVKSVRRIVARGEIKVHRIGNRIRVSPEDVATYENLKRD